LNLSFDLCARKELHSPGYIVVQPYPVRSLVGIAVKFGKAIGCLFIREGRGNEFRASLYINAYLGQHVQLCGIDVK